MEIAARKPAELSLPISAPDAIEWSPESPVLYLATATLQVSGQIVDAASARFGFRTIATQGTQLILNGKPLKLLGFNRHEESVATGLATNLEISRQDLRHMKRMGGNFLRIHYPMDRGTLDLCDELGILVMSEMPAAGNGACSQAQAAAYLAKMIARDRNRPSVIFWSVSNESDEQKRLIVEWNDNLVQLARKLDPTRLAVHVSERGRWTTPRNHPLFTYDSVICLNGYPSELGRIWAKDPDYDFQKSRQYWEQALAEIHRRYPDKPILVTEFGYPTGNAVDGAAGAAMQGRAIEAEFCAFHAQYICGAAIWCWADHPWPKKRFYSENSPYGIFTRDRKSKGGGVEELVARLYKGGLPIR